MRKIPHIVSQYNNDIHSLKNPFRIFRTKSEKIIFAKARFIHESSINSTGKTKLNKLDYKFIQFNDNDIIIYDINQSLKIFNENTINSSNYLATYKLQNLDLPCNNLYFICTLGELKREYKSKLKDVDFKTNKKVLKVLSNKVANKNCIVFNIGFFKNVSELAYMCFDDLEDTIFYSNLISERILENYQKDYQGAIKLVDQVNFNFL